MLSRAAKTALRNIGRNCGPKCSRPWFLVEDGKYLYPSGREIRGGGVTELIERGIFKPESDGLFPGMAQTYKFDPASALR